MSLRSIGACAALWLAACAGVPSESAPTAAPGAAPAPQVTAAGDGDGMVCRDEQITGTHVNRTICRSKAEIQRERAAAEREMQRMNQLPSIKSGK